MVSLSPQTPAVFLCVSAPMQYKPTKASINARVGKGG